MTLPKNPNTEEVKNEKTKKPDRVEQHKSAKFTPFIVMAVAALFAALLLIGSISSAYGEGGTKAGVNSLSENSASGNAVEEQSEAATEEVSEEATTEAAMVAAEVTKSEEESEYVEAHNWHFYNLDLQDDGIAENDLDFGINPILSNVSLEDLKELIKKRGLKGTIKVEEIISTTEVEEIDKDFRARLREDPALGAADLAWFDSILGTRYLGVFYSEAKEKWDVAMNDAKDHFIEHPDEYNAKLDAFEKYLDYATKVEIRKVDKGLTDQMYMNSKTESGIPDIIVMETANHDGWFLVYTFTIKGTTTKEVMYRLDCGYQPTNVAKVMNVTPKKRTSGGGGSVIGGGGTVAGGGIINTMIAGGGGTSKTGGGKGKPGGGGGGGDDPGYNKDSSKGTQVLSNDTSGPGPNTNNGVGAQYSTADQATNSNSMTQSEYQQAVEQLQQANETSREGGESNAPSTQTGGDVTVDNNGSSGSDSSASIDTPTDTSSSSVANDQSGDSWDGPPE